MVALAQPSPPHRNRFINEHQGKRHPQQRGVHGIVKSIDQLGEGIPLLYGNLPDILKKAAEYPADHFGALQKSQHGYRKPRLGLVIGLGQNADSHGGPLGDAHVSIDIPNAFFFF